jgi:hypothetical protein
MICNFPLCLSEAGTLRAVWISSENFQKSTNSSIGIEEEKYGEKKKRTNRSGIG